MTGDTDGFYLKLQLASRFFGLIDIGLLAVVGKPHVLTEMSQ